MHRNMWIMDILLNSDFVKWDAVTAIQPKIIVTVKFII